ncbi:zf-TFIIB domain-containing protein, partial [Micromonospora chalcea]|uniref:TFIIB-type zinc ribbon-containing protein n=1 Tax=Micromonospora chalcea TaxID=1874 RepID=UPI001F41D4A8
MQMTCPKCRGEMRQYERSGVVIDQCGECRGIFLDRGELEKLFDAEANWNQQHGGDRAQGGAAGGGDAPLRLRRGHAPVAGQPGHPGRPDPP